MTVIATIGPTGASRSDPPAASRLLETKLYVPRPQAGLVARPRLIDAVRAGVERKLTLVVAPAGFGKTTLLAASIAAWLGEGTGAERSAGWVSLDASENEPTLFWSYVVRALQKRHPTVGADALALLRSPRTPIESVLTALINELDALDGECLLVLDDYHVIDAAPVHDTLALLVDRLPRRMHVLVASRAEPPLPLARLRARGELAELRAADLRFTADEAATYLNQVMALRLSTGDAATLERRTEGWIAGLKLAALSMQRSGDVRGFVDGFSGGDRYVADYLVDEVLNAEPEPVRRFLLGTAILDRLSGPLCDAVVDGHGSHALLEELERRGLFVVPLDDRREWYRYHHLFADVLRARATQEGPQRVRACHRRASAWYERAGSRTDAVRHAFGAEDYEHAAGLLETAWPEKDRSHQAAQWLGRVKALPDGVVRARPVLTMGYAWALLNAGELEAAEPRLRDVERWLAVPAGAEDGGGPPNAPMVVADEAQFRALPIELAAARVYLGQARGAAPATLDDARRALDLVPDGDDASRATATALLALAHWGRGELDDAYRTFADALALMRKGGHALDAIRGIFVLGDLRATQGRLREAARIYEDGLRVAAEQAGAAAAETDELHVGLSALHCEWGALDAAERHLQAITTSAERTAHRGKRAEWCAAMARVREALGDPAGALALLDEAEAHDVRGPLPRVRPIAAMRARLWLRQGRVAEAKDWARACGLTVGDGLSYAREYEHVTLARVLAARHATEGDEFALRDAAELLERLSTAAEEGGRWRSVVETLVLQAIVRNALGDVRGALRPLARALALAEAEGYVRVFVDEGVRVRDLLRQATARGIGGEYTRRVLAAFDAPARPIASPAATSAATGSAGEPTVGPVGALTPRELEVIRLIAAGLRNQEIAEQLAISLATVKRHVANAYAKLGAGHRTEALARAKALGVL